MRMCGHQTSGVFKALQIGLNGRRGRIYSGKLLIMHRERRNVYEYSIGRLTLTQIRVFVPLSSPT